MIRTFACLALAQLAMAPAASGHDTEFTSEQLADVQRCVDRLDKVLESGGLTAEAAASFDLGGFASLELGDIPEAIRSLEPDVRDALRRVCRTAYYRRGPAGRLNGAREICFQLAGPRDADWLQAFRLLRREKLDEALELAVVALGRDGRPEVRLIASRLAASLLVFGRSSEGLVGTVLDCLTDRDPCVAAACATQDALVTRDKRVVDRMVAALADERVLDPLAAPADRHTVRDFVVQRLSWAIFMERKALWKLRPKLDATGEVTLDRTGEPDYENLSPDAIRAWWQEHRNTFAFGTPASHWRKVADQVIVLEVGRPMHVQVASGQELTVNLRDYREDWSEGRPVTTAQAEITARAAGEEEYVATVGAPDQPDGSLSWERGIWPDGTGLADFVCQGAFLPTEKPGRVRVRLIIHIGGEERK